MSETETATHTMSDFQSADVAAVHNMLLLSKQGDNRKHSLDSSNDDHDDSKASRRNSMPLKKRHKTSGSFLGSSIGMTEEQAPERPTPVPSAADTITSPMTGSINTSSPSYAALSSLLGKSDPIPDLATRLEAFKEAQRRSKFSRELLAQATKGLASSSHTLSAMSLASRMNRLNSLSSLLGKCSRSSSFGASRSGSLVGASATASSSLGAAMRSW